MALGDSEEYGEFVLDWYTLDNGNEAATDDGGTYRVERSGDQWRLTTPLPIEHKMFPNKEAAKWRAEDLHDEYA